MNSKDRYFVFRLSNGCMLFTTNDRDELYNHIYHLSHDLTYDYIIYDNKENVYIFLEGLSYVV